MSQKAGQLGLPKVSVAMTTYRARPEFLQAQLESIRDQSRPVDEVVICDDHSEDGTLERLETFIQDNGLGSSWSVIEHDKNCRVDRSVRDALAATTGDVIFLADQDDVWHSDKVERMVAVFEAHPQVKSLLGNYDTIDEHGNRLTLSRRGDNLYFQDWDDRLDEHLYHVRLCSILAHNIAPGATQAIARSVAEQFPKVKGHKRMHDWRMNIIAALADDGLFYTDAIYTDYRLHSNNTVGIERGYLELPERQGLRDRVRWGLSFLKRVLAETWRDRHEPYGRLSAYELGNNGARDNVPSTIKKSYFGVCRPSDAVKSEFKAWAHYIKALGRAVEKRSFLRLLKLRMTGAEFHRRRFVYYRWPDRLACLVRDLFFSLCGPR